MQPNLLITRFLLPKRIKFSSTWARGKNCSDRVSSTIYITEVRQNTTSFGSFNNIKITCFDLNKIIFRFPTNYKTC